MKSHPLRPALYPVAGSLLPASLLCNATHAAEAFSLNSKWILGDWGGKRIELLEKGYDFKLEYVGEAVTSLDGGCDGDETGCYTDQFIPGVHMDLEKILGWKAVEFQSTVTKRDGKNLSNNRIDDPRTRYISSVQEVWGREQTWRLTQLWLKQQCLDGVLDVKFGRFGEGEDLNSPPCDFQNPAFCDSQVDNWAGSIWYNRSVSQQALQVKHNFTPDWYVQVGVHEQNPSNPRTGNGFKMGGNRTKGVLLPVELIWRPKAGAEQLPGEHRLGYYYSTAKTDNVYDGVDGQSRGLTNNNFKSRGSKHGWWVVVQQQVISHNDDTSRGLSLFANLTVHDKATNMVDNYQRLGVVYKGPFNVRPKNDIGLGIAHIHVSDDVKKRQRLVNRVNGIDGYDNLLYRSLQDTEYNAELYYGVHVTDWLTVWPNLQYIKQPGGVDEVGNVLVAGIKIQTVFQAVASDNHDSVMASDHLFSATQRGAAG